MIDRTATSGVGDLLRILRTWPELMAAAARDETQCEQRLAMCCMIRSVHGIFGEGISNAAPSFIAAQKKSLASSSTTSICNQ